MWMVFLAIPRAILRLTVLAGLTLASIIATGVRKAWAVSWNFGSGTINVSATETNEHFGVSVSGGNVYVWSETNSTSESVVGHESVNYITLHGGTGNDTVEVLDIDTVDSMFPNLISVNLTGDGNSGSGDDVLIGGPGGENLWGDGGDDIIYGGGGNDSIIGGNGDDTIYGDDTTASANDGNDTIVPGLGYHEIYGGGGNDSIKADTSSQAFHDTIYGDFSTSSDYDGDDTIYGGRLEDRIYGGGGDDRLYGEDGYDTIYGDLPTWSADDGDDTIDGGDRGDSLLGGGGDDTIVGGGITDSEDFLVGGLGNDTLYGGRDNDTLWGDEIDEHGDWDGGIDVLFGADDDDELYGGGNHDVLYGGAGNDTLMGGGRDDTILGQSGSDHIWGEGNVQQIMAATYDGDATETRLDDAEMLGYDSIYGDDLSPTSGSSDTIYGNGGNDTIHGGGGIDSIGGDRGDDRIYGDAGGDLIQGQRTLVGGLTTLATSGDPEHILIQTDSDTIYGDDGTGRMEMMKSMASQAAI